MMSIPCVLPNVLTCSIVNDFIAVFTGDPLNFKSLYLGNEKELRPHIQVFHFSIASIQLWMGKKSEGVLRRSFLVS